MALQAAITVTAHAGETLDALVWRTLGRGRGSVEEILAVNPGLAAVSEAMPEGYAVVIPPAADADELAVTEMVQLWT
jgi:phage tail protein X